MDGWSSVCIYSIYNVYEIRYCVAGTCSFYLPERGCLHLPLWNLFVYFFFSPLKGSAIWKIHPKLMNNLKPVCMNLWLKSCCNLTITWHGVEFFYVHSLNLNQSNFHRLNQWFAFSLIHQRKNIFHCEISGKIFSPLYHLIFTEAISEIWLIYSNLFLAIWISQISLIISRFWLIHI